MKTMITLLRQPIIPNLLLPFIILLLTSLISCKKGHINNLSYYEVGMKQHGGEWRDTSFVVATANPLLIQQIDAEFQLPILQRKMVFGALAPGSKGYNKNATHEFKWHFKEDEWELAEVSIEIYDGRPYSDVDADTAYWLQTVKTFAPWNSYIRKKIK
jgi:hypothetical protein